MRVRNCSGISLSVIKTGTFHFITCTPTLVTLEQSGVVTRAEFNRMLAEQADPKAAKAAARKRKDQE